MKIEFSKKEEGEILADIRVAAMKESLEALGRFDPVRARERFLSNFQADKTKVVRINDQIVAFFVVLNKSDHLYLDHLYVHPNQQGSGIGRQIMQIIIKQAADLGVSVRLGALKGSRSNNFYQSLGFVKSHEEEFDNFYELRCS